MSNQSIDIASETVVRRSALRPNGLWVLLALIIIMALMPLIASPYVLLLMLPFIGYSIALLGFNLLFGGTGLLSFGHALFLGVGAYTAAALTSKFGVLNFELLLLAAALFSGLISLVVGALCVRYTRIFFGMLTLAFGMLFHSFLFKFYSITGGDQGMRVLRPLLLGMEWRGGKTAFLTGVHYYALLQFAPLGSVAHHAIAARSYFRAIRENAGQGRLRHCRFDAVGRVFWRFMAESAELFLPLPPAWRILNWRTGPIPAIWCSWPSSAAAGRLRDPRSAHWPLCCCRIL